MPALNFQERFAPLILSGKKRQTIRAFRKRPIKPGDTLILYIGMRTKQCRHLDNVKCREVQAFRIADWGFSRFEEGATFSDDHIYTLEPKVLNRFARKDGFKDWPEMREWFRKQHGLPFTGVLIRW